MTNISCFSESSAFYVLSRLKGMLNRQFKWHYPKASLPKNMHFIILISTTLVIRIYEHAL